MDEVKGQPHQGLVGTVVAALSKRSRRSVHPADHRRLLEEAMRVATAVETAFSLIERPPCGAISAKGDTPALAQTYE